MDSQNTTQTTILVVDDDALINIGTADMVAGLGYRALEAYSGKEALEILSNDNAIGVLITDYSMPGMNGVELADKARTLRPDLHVVLATGYGEDLPNGEVSALPRLNKPFQQADLVAYLQTVLDRA